MAKHFLEENNGGIIIETHKNFRLLPNWIKLKEKLGDDIKIRKGRNEHADKDAIRIYRMSLNPNEHVLKTILNFVFENK